jgi:hypothetical protein
LKGQENGGELRENAGSQNRLLMQFVIYVDDEAIYQVGERDGVSRM